MTKKIASKNELQAQFEDAILTIAFLDYADELGNQLRLDNEAANNREAFRPTEKQSKEFIKALYRHSRAERNAKFMKIMKHIGRAAVIVLAIFTLAFSIPFITVDAFREKVINFFIETTDRYTEMAPTATATDEDHLPAYVPEGFRLSFVERDGDGIQAEYKSETGDVLLYMKDAAVTHIQVDTEDAEYSKWIDFRENKALITEKNGVSSIVWYTTDSCYMIAGKISRNDILKMAESIN